jgi:heat shock protein 5
MDDPDMKRDLKHWPFDVLEKNGKPAIHVNYKGEARDFVSTTVLISLRPKFISI